MRAVTRGSSAQQPSHSRLVMLAFLAMGVLGVILRLPAFVEPIGIDQGIFITAGWDCSGGFFSTAICGTRNPRVFT
jgi:hypothetical protein